MQLVFYAYRIVAQDAFHHNIITLISSFKGLYTPGA